MNSNFHLNACTYQKETTTARSFLRTVLINAQNTTSSIKNNSLKDPGTSVIIMAELKQKVSFEEIAEFRSKFDKYVLPSSEKISIESFDELIKECDEQIPQFKLRKVVCDRRAAGEGDELEFGEFLDIFSKLSTKTIGASFKQAVEKRENINTVSTSSASAQGTKHSFLDAEKEMFSSWISTCLKDDTSLKGQCWLPASDG